VTSPDRLTTQPADPPFPDFPPNGPSCQPPPPPWTPGHEHQILSEHFCPARLPITTRPASGAPINYVVATTTHTGLPRCRNDVVAATPHPPKPGRARDRSPDQAIGPAGYSRELLRKI